jgi:hypothetical protein
MLWSMARYMELRQDSDIFVFYTAVHMHLSVVRIYMELGQDSDITVQVLVVHLTNKYVWVTSCHGCTNDNSWLNCPRMSCISNLYWSTKRGILAYHLCAHLFCCRCYLLGKRQKRKKKQGCHAPQDTLWVLWQNWVNLVMYMNHGRWRSKDRGNVDSSSWLFEVLKMVSFIM